MSGANVPSRSTTPLRFSILYCGQSSGVTIWEMTLQNTVLYIYGYCSLCLDIFPMVNVTNLNPKDDKHSCTVRTTTYTSVLIEVRIQLIFHGTSSLITNEKK